jgi:uncharacterized protein (TIGR03435 family)
MNAVGMDDTELLREFAARHSEEAFRMLVERHIGFVYSVALRQLRNPSAAQEATQAVFIDLAAKAAVISEKTILTGWLFRAVRFAAAKFIRAEVRRQRREREAAEMETTLQENNADSPWEQMEPLLNEALEELPEKDRCAVLLRFFEKKPLKDVAARLGLNEAAAKKRVGRAVEKLRLIFQKRGVVIPAAVIFATLSTQSVQAAPAGLASTIAATAILKSAALTKSTIVLKGILKLMALSKIKTAVVATVALLLVAGTTTYVIQKDRPSALLGAEDEDAAAYKIIKSGSSRVLDTAPPLVFLRASRPPVGPSQNTTADSKMMGAGKSIEQLISIAYGVSETRLEVSTPLPKAKYDYLVSLPSGQKEALQQALREKLGLIAHVETRPEEVYVLKSKPGDFPGLQPTTAKSGSGSSQTGDGSINFVNATLSTFSKALEQFLDRPVVNEANHTGRLDINLTWSEAGAPGEGLKQAMGKQLGLEVIPEKRDVEFLIVQKSP